MQDRLYINDLESYKKASENERKKVFKLDKNYYDFEKVEDEYIREKIKEFVLYKAKNVSIGAMYHYVFLYNQICDFFNDTIPKIDLKNGSRENILAKYKAHLLSMGKPLFKVYNLKHDNSDRVNNPHSYNYLNQFLKFAYKEEEEKDILYVADFPQMGNNPANPVKYFNLSKIRQMQMRDEIREAVIFSTTYKNARTIKSEIYAANKFSEFLDVKYHYVKSCSEIKKIHISEYIIYLKVESGYKARTYCTLIGSLKILLEVVSSIYEYGEIGAYFSCYEYMKSMQPIERAYSRYELRRFNKSLKTLDEQMARCLVLHQLLGTRISDTLLLETTCLKYKNGKPVIVIRQPKVSRGMEKPINDEIVRLVKKSIDYTRTKYGSTRYIFVSGKNLDLPLSYGTLKYWVEEMIRKNNIKDDFGDPLFFGTHAFRRYYGKRLTELHIDDVTIAKLLGHSGIQCVDRYRKMGSLQIAEETRPFRNYMDNVIKDISAEW